MDEIKTGEKIRKNLYDYLSENLTKDESQQSQIDEMMEVVEKAKSQKGG